MYRFRSFIAALFAAAFALTSVPLSGQSYRNAIGFVGGGTWSSQMAPGTTMDPRLEPNWNAGLEVERWLGSGRIGLRLSGSFSENQVTNAGTQMKLLTGDASLLLRLLSAQPGRVMAPFISLGAGAMIYNSTDPRPFIGGEVQMEMDPTTRPGAMAGFGIDLSPTPGVGLRLEGVDRFAIQSPFVNGAFEAYDPVHHVRYSASIQIRFGRLAESEPVFAAATPVEAPPEPEEAEPVPSAEPTATRAAPDPEPDAPDEPVSRETARNERASAAAEGTSGMFTVQIAAFEHRPSAWRLAERMSGDDIPAWVTRFEHGGRVYHRVRVGVVPTEAEAQRLGRRLRAEYGSPVWVVPVEPSVVISSDAVVATRAFMNGS